MEHWNIYGILEEMKKNTKVPFSTVVLSMTVRQGGYSTLLIGR
jgi:hypothetical protein